MKNIEATIPHQSVRAIIEELRALDVDEITVEPVKLYKKGLRQTMIYRGCDYVQDFVSASQIRFVVSDQDAFQAETIVAHAA